MSRGLDEAISSTTSDCQASSRGAECPRARLVALWAVGIAVGIAVSPSIATAAIPGTGDSVDAVNYEPPATQRRGGFTLGLSPTAGVATFSGYPNEVAKLGVERFETSTGATFGPGFNVFFGGALRDWLTVGVGGTYVAGATSSVVGSSFSPIFRVEAYPLYFLDGAFRDLGLGFEGGASFGKIVDASDPTLVLADGGSMAHVGLSAFYEPFQFWQLSSGPGLTYTHDFSQSLTIHQVALSWRLVFYGVQPRGKGARDEDLARRSAL